MLHLEEREALNEKDGNHTRTKSDKCQTQTYWTGFFSLTICAHTILTCSSTVFLPMQEAKGSLHKILIKLQPDGLQRNQTIPQSCRADQGQQEETQNSPPNVVPVLLGPHRRKFTVSVSASSASLLQTHSTLQHPQTLQYRLPPKGLNEGESR